MERSVTLATAAIAMLTLAVGCGPLGPIPGGSLRGEVHEGPPASWAEFTEVEQVQLETNPADPHSVNTWIGFYEGRLYIPTSLILGDDNPMDRTWVRNVLEDPNVRVRIEGVLYPLRAIRVEEGPELDGARALLLEKYDVEADEHVAKGWIFRLEPR